MSRRSPRWVAGVFLVACSVAAEPIVINGAMVPALLGSEIAGLRMVNSRGDAIPFQVDERNPAGEYICPLGEQPNADAANGKLDSLDEIVFLWEDAGETPSLAEGRHWRTVPGALERITVAHGSEQRYVWIGNNPLVPLSAERYITYDHERQCIKTPYFFAQFGRDRFHFIKAGVMDFGTGSYRAITNELRVEIVFKALWGLVPITYTEDNIVCTVTRYKTGPVRLIRRGDFHLRLGLGLKGSRAAVYQICYPQVVKVPVRVHLPARFRTLFSEAFIEMTPVLNAEARHFRFIIPSLQYEESRSNKSVDTLFAAIPDRGYLVSDGVKGYGWITSIDADTTLLSGSGYLLRRPSKRGGIAECGFRLTVRDLPRGDYDIVNWVFFPRDRIDAHKKELLTVLEPATVSTEQTRGLNLLVAKNARRVR